jgi:flagellin
LNSVDGSEIKIEQKDAATRALTGLVDTNNANSVGNSVADIDISTAAGAQKAIGILDNALEQVNSVRGDLGAISNRLDYTMNNLSNIAENQAAARSRIEDADFAKESANLSRAQVLQQAGTAMLAQANAAPQQVLSLLQ